MYASIHAFFLVFQTAPTPQTPSQPIAATKLPLHEQDNTLDSLQELVDEPLATLDQVLDLPLQIVR